MMNRSLHTYLHNSLRSAIIEKFPLIETAGLNIGFFCEVPDKSADIGTPVAFRLATQTGQSPCLTAELLMSGFRWDNAYVRPDPSLEHTVKNGFINFTISASFLHGNLRRLSRESFAPHIKTSGILKKTGALVNLFFSDSANKRDLNTVSLENLTEPLERELIGLVAIAMPRTANAAKLFYRKISSLLEEYYKKYPVFTEHEMLTRSRILLIRAVHNHLCFLLDINFTISDF